MFILASERDERRRDVPLPVLRIEGLPGQVQVRGFDGDARPVWMEDGAPHPVADGERRVPFVLASFSDDDAAVVAVVVARRRGFHAV